MAQKLGASNVREQYERYPFPLRRPQDESGRLIVSEVDRLAKIDHCLFRGTRDFREPFRVLIAGGGTGDALLYLGEQLRECPVEFVFLDMSQASLDVARARAKARELQAVEWIHGSLLDLPTLGLGEFDYINCIGVLHHLPDPEEGLAALNSCLAPDGGMGLMLYGKYGRRNVYTMQELLGLIGSPDQDLESKVELTRRAILDLGSSNRIQLSADAQAVIEQAESDAYLVDTYLHGQDRAYSVAEIHELLATSSLSLAAYTNFFDEQGFVCSLDYNPDLLFEDPALVQRLAALDDPKREHIAEIIGAKISMHAFYVSRAADSAASLLDLDLAPAFVTDFGGSMASWIEEEEPESIDLTLCNGTKRNLPLAPLTRHVISRIDGKRSLRQHIEEAIALEAEREWAQTHVLSTIDLLIGLGLCHLRHCQLPAIPRGVSSRSFQGALDFRSVGEIETAAL